MNNKNMCGDWKITIKTWWDEKYIEYFSGITDENEFDDAIDHMRNHYSLTRDDVTSLRIEECPGLLETEPECYYA